MMIVNVDNILTRKTKYDDKNEYDGEREKDENSGTILNLFLQPFQSRKV